MILETATGRTQWEHPVDYPTETAESAVQYAQPQPPPGHTKRRQYAAGQTQAYYGAPESVASYPDPASYVAPQPGGQLFTPGLNAPEQPGYPAQPQPAPYYGGADPGYSNGQYPQVVPPAAQSGIHQVTDQFNQMNLGQKPVGFHYASFSLNDTSTDSIRVVFLSNC